MKYQVLFSSKNESEKKYRLLQFLFAAALRVYVLALG